MGSEDSDGIHIISGASGSLGLKTTISKAPYVWLRTEAKVFCNPSPAPAAITPIVTIDFTKGLPSPKGPANDLYRFAMPLPQQKPHANLALLPMQKPWQFSDHY